MRTRRPDANWRAWLSTLATDLTIRSDERALGGLTAGVLWLFGGLSLMSFPFLPGVPHHHWAGNTIDAAYAVIWGICSLWLIDWDRANPYVQQVSTLIAYVVVGVAVASTGGAASNAWVYLWMVGMFVCYFYGPSVAVIYIALCLITQALPLLYDGRAAHDGYLAPLIGASVGYITIGGGVALGRERFHTMRARAETLAAEQGALQRAASAVLAGETPERVYQIVSEELGHLLGVSAAGVFKRAGEGEVTLLNAWTDGTIELLPPGTVLPALEGNTFSRALSGAVTVRGVGPVPGALGNRLGFGASMATPIVVDGEIWGTLAVGAHEHERLSRAAEAQIEAFADLLANIAKSIEERNRLATEALTDQLTGLPNHRALHRRLESDLANADRHRQPLALALLDIDHFKGINDLGGHEAGDCALQEVSACLLAASRAGDTVGRLGGDEFMWILPNTDGEQARVAVERARELVQHSVKEPRPTTISAGLCERRHAGDATGLQHRADVALYASKNNGRNRVTSYYETLS